MPTIGQLKRLSAVFDLDFALACFERDDFLLPGFLRERDALVLAFRFAMALLILVGSHTPHKFRFPSQRQT
jgi:hypothetical protein